MDWATLGMSGLLAPVDDKNVPQSLRQRIALAMLMKKQAYPKTFGEGLSSIGDSLGDAFLTRSIYRDAAANETAGQGFERSLADPGASAASPAPVRSYAPPDANTSAPPLARQPVATPAIAQPGNNGPVPGGVPVPTDALPDDTNPPGAPYRQPTVPRVVNGAVVQPGPLQAPPPAVQSPPPQQPAGGFSDRFNAARPGQQSALEPPPGTPVMAAGNEPSAEERNDARNALTQQLMQRFGARPGGPPPNPTLGGAGSPPAADPAPAISSAPPPPQAQIRSMPPPQPPQPAPQHPPVGAGYVPQMKPEPPMPPTTTPKLQEIARAIREAPGSLREIYTARAQTAIAQENARLTAAHEKWKDDLIDVRTHNAAVEQAKIGQQGRIDTSEKARQEIAKGNIPEVKQDVDTGLTYNPETKQWEQPKIAGGDGKPTFKGTEFQGKTLVNYGRAKLAHDALTPEREEVLSGSPMQSALTSLGVRGARSEEYKEADTASENFVQAFIRQQSGAGFGEKELEAEARGMIPKYGDPQSVLDQKRIQREAFVNNLHSVIGPSGQKVANAEIAAAKAAAAAAKAAADKPKEAADPLEGREALLPDKTIVVRRGGKWVPK